MSKIFIIGSTGGVGSRLCPLLVESGHEVTGLYRKEEQKETLLKQGVKPYLADLIDMSEEELIEATKGNEVIVFCAGATGSGLDRTEAIDKEGVIKAIAAAKANNISRFYLVSVIMDAGRQKARKEGFEFHMKCKREADNALVASDLKWLILRPGTLVTEDGNGLVNANYAVPYGNVARGNVAKTLAKLINTPSLERKIIELTDGKNTVESAIDFLVQND